ncbi:endonuclease III domain-containing protein [Lacticaseibacillus daqingensis]|uniref:endonuclease III domain-containing protein n=1 Tax=Lacticaseibacillus daqingensis TaxID=2486014 RepID=UPI000F78FBD5|nr:deoxyribonuclease I [Lacticaseibacillus daqingensis]
MPSAELDLTALYHTLAEWLGPSGWWPADSKIEIAVGAILVQNTAWQNVDRSLTNLRQVTAFDPHRLHALPQATLIELIRPSGFYQNKSRALMGLWDWLAQWDFDLTQPAAMPPAELRQTLLSLRGIGAETADAMRLYVFDQPTFVGDQYARRLFGWLGQPFASYAKLFAATHSVAAWPLQDAQELHGLIDNLGKQIKTAPDLVTTPLAHKRLILR